MGFYDANYNITKLKKSGGKITEIALNGVDVPIGGDLEDNKAKTINVSTYTAPVEVTPTSGKDGMKKATITLSNIPSEVTKLYCWKQHAGSTLSNTLYTLSATPSTGDNYLESSDSSPLIELKELEEGTLTDYERDSDGDITL